MTDDVQQQITWLLCFDDGEADHIGAARCAETMKSQQARIELLEKVLAAAKWLTAEVERDHDLDRLSIDSENCAQNMRDRIADCDNKPAPTKKPGKAHPWRKTQAPQR